MATFLIIGASSGIGKATASKLSDQGHQVYGTFNKNETAIEGIEFQHFNVLDTEELFVPEKLDGLVYCPGAINLKPFKMVNERDLLSDYKLQVIGAINIIQRTLPALKKGKHPSILLFSSVATQVGFPFHSIVSSSKGAINGLVSSLAAEFAPAVRVNGIAPGLTQTELSAQFLNSERKKTTQENKIPMGQIGKPEDIASCAAYLLNEANWVTGQIISVDGGMSSVNH